MVEIRRADQLLVGDRRPRHRRQRTPGGVPLGVAGPEQAERRGAGRRGEMHEPGIVADEEPAALEAGRRTRQVDGADQIEHARARQGVDQRLGLGALVAGAEQRDARTGQGRAGRGQAPGQPGAFPFRRDEH